MSRHPYVDALNRAREAVARKRIAEENCPHWDYDETDGGEHACCHEMREASEAARRARAALARVQGGAL